MQTTIDERNLKIEHQEVISENQQMYTEELLVNL